MGTSLVWLYRKEFDSFSLQDVKWGSGCYVCYMFKTNCDREVEMKGYELFRDYCKTCAKIKLHETCYDKEEDKDYKVCQSCGNKEEVEKKEDLVLKSMKRW